MLLAPDDGQRQIVDAVADALLQEAPFDRWYLPQTDALAEEARLSKFGAEMGWIGIAAPEDVGGSAADLTDEMLVFREIGARLGPVGLMASALATQVAIISGDTVLASEFVSGGAIAALASPDDATVLIGSARATHSLHIVGDQISISLAPSDAMHALAIDETSSSTISPLTLQIASITSPELVLRFRLLVAAQQQGLSETALNESNAYAKMREQFGRAIGSFQAVRHRIADMALRTKRSEAQLYFAAVAVRDGRPDAQFQVLAALILANQAARENAQVNIANHGAIGVTTENIGHLLLKRAMLWAFLAGREDMLLDELAELEPALL
jgi:alkylation response protein AidB-like acyl-CoA dehydrogenase